MAADKVFRQKIRRKLIQIAAFGFTNCHAGNFITGKLYNGKFKEFCTPGLNCYSCPAATVSCPIGSLLAVTGRADLKVSFYVWGFLLAIGAVLGRAVCGFLCPFGLIQDLLGAIPVRKFRLPKILTYVKYAVLALMVIIIPTVLIIATGHAAPLYCKYICPAGMLEGAIPLLLTHETLRDSAGVLFWVKLAILLAVIAGSVFVRRFFCKIGCPLGAIYGLLNKVSLYHLTVDRDKCIDCGKCAGCCPMDVDPVKAPRSAECIRCGACKAVCPKGAITIGFGSGRKTAKREGLVDMNVYSRK